MSFRQAVIAAILSAALAANVHDRSYYESKFFNWMAEHKITASSGESFVQMIQNFADNDDAIEKHNSGKHTYTLGHNKFSHMNRAEWSAYVKGLNTKPTSTATFTHTAPKDVSTLADSVDWIAKGAVSGVKDQGQCGSCWAFSTVGALEGAYQIKKGNLQTFSEQQLVSCDSRHGEPRGTDMGCNGGLMDNAFEWIGKNGGLCSEEAYPYVSGKSKQDETCTKGTKDECSVVPGSTVTSFVDVETNSDAAMKSALNIGPVAIAIEADQMAFQLYKSGVFTGECGAKLDHGVLCTGYGTQDGLGYYMVKNSWGDSWGEGGYIKLQMGVDQKEGQCGMLSGPPSYPLV